MGRTHTYAVSPIDENHLLYGNFIGLQFAYETPLKAETLDQAIQILEQQFPALTGHYDSHSKRVIPSKSTLSLKRHNSTESLSDILSRAERPDFIDQPNRRKVLRGNAPLSTFTLTEFRDGGQIFGMALSHVLTDAAGYHKLMHHLSMIYHSITKDRTPPDFPFATQLEVFQFGTSQSKKETLAALNKRDLPKPIPIKGLSGKVVKSLIIKAMEKSLRDNPPIKLHFTPEHISRLKDTVLRESGEDWISTNIALCAHFTSLIAKLSYGENIKTEMQIGQLLDLRNRYFKKDVELQANYFGNAILIHIEKAAFPEGLQHTLRGALAQYFKFRQEKTTPKDVKTRLDLLADCLRHGYTNPELDVKNPIISLNNQSKMPVYDISFGGQHPTQIIPQDVGDNIMFFPARDGGIDIFIRDIVNPMGQEKLLTLEWQKRIFDF